MIVGVGIELVDRQRFESLLHRYGDRLRDRLFTAGEREYAARKKRDGESLATLMENAGRAVAEEFAHKTPLPPELGDGGPEERRFWPVVAKYENGVELHFRPGSKAYVFHGERGRLVMRRNRFKTSPADLVKDHQRVVGGVV